MPVGYISGKTGFVLVDGVPYPFGKWNLEIRGILPKVNNWLLGARQGVVPGLIAGVLTLDGPVTGLGFPLVCTARYTFICGYSANLALTVPGLVETLKSSNDVEGAPMLTATVQSDGDFSVSVIM
jgi:hypothetical protein